MLKPILLVEDNAYDRELALIALSRAKLANDTVVVNDGIEALDYLFRRGAYASRTPGNPSVVLLDLKMPKINGIEVLDAVRAHPETACLPVVMLTGSKEEADVTKSYELRANAYVVKPMDFSELVRVVSELGLFWAVLNEPPVGSMRFVPEPG
jgi:CheY-like chemotaxis protein